MVAMSAGGVTTVIDQARGIAPRAFDRQGASSRDPVIAGRLSELERLAQGCDADGILRLALVEQFAGKTAVVSSFGAESAVLLHMIAAIDPTTPVLFLNTGKLFGETLRYRDRLQDVLGLTDIRSIGPHPADRERLDPEGTLWSRNTDACCDFRKVVPIKRALEGFAAQITGRKRFQTSARTAMRTVEYFEGRFRFNPLKPTRNSTTSRAIRSSRTATPPSAACPVPDGFWWARAIATAAGPASKRTNAASTSAWTAKASDCRRAAWKARHSLLHPGPRAVVAER
jgi:hypothetical protein